MTKLMTAALKESVICTSTRDAKSKRRKTSVRINMPTTEAELRIWNRLSVQEKACVIVLFYVMSAVFPWVSITAAFAFFAGRECGIRVGEVNLRLEEEKRQNMRSKIMEELSALNSTSNPSNPSNPPEPPTPLERLQSVAEEVIEEEIEEELGEEEMENECAGEEEGEEKKEEEKEE